MGTSEQHLYFFTTVLYSHQCFSSSVLSQRAMGYGNYCYPVSSIAVLCLAADKSSVTYDPSDLKLLLNWTSQPVVSHR